MNQPRIIIPGGTGFLGRHVSAYFAAQNYEVVVLTRSPKPDSLARQVAWDGETLGTWANEFDGAAAVINLAGRTVNCRYTEKNKREIYDSRLRSTAVIGKAIAQCAVPPPVWINSSSATIYRYAEDRAMDEATGEIGTGFSVDVCQQWEKALNEAATPHTRKIALRAAMVFGHGEDGPYAMFHRLVRFGLGGTMGHGRQYISWIHIADFTRALAWLIAHDELAGAINLSSPNPMPSREFMRAFREVCHQPIGLPATRWMLELGAFFLRTETELPLKSRRVVPSRLLESGFVLKFPSLREALQNLIAPTAVV